MNELRMVSPSLAICSVCFQSYLVVVGLSCWPHGDFFHPLCTIKMYLNFQNLASVPRMCQLLCAKSIICPLDEKIAKSRIDSLSLPVHNTLNKKYRLHIPKEMKYFLCKLSLFALFTSGHASKVKSTVISASADTCLRKDRQYQNYGRARHLTVTKDKARNARVALLNFEIESAPTDQATRAMLRLYIADVDAVYEERIVLIKRVNDPFEEDNVSWDSYDAHSEGEEWIEFHVHNEHVGKIGQVDVSTLMVPGKSLTLAIHTSEKGHVKFASREHEDASAHPKILMLQGDEF